MPLRYVKVVRIQMATGGPSATVWCAAALLAIAGGCSEDGAIGTGAGASRLRGDALQGGDSATAQGDDTVEPSDPRTPGDDVGDTAMGDTAMGDAAMGDTATTGVTVSRVSDPRRCCEGACDAENPRLFFMAPSGSDEADGRTAPTAWASFDRAQDELGPGDMLCLEGGVYRGQAAVWRASGSAEQPLVVSAMNGQTPVFDGEGGPDGVRMKSTDPTMHVVFDGLEFMNYTRSGMFVNYAQHVTIRNSTFHDIGTEARAALQLGIRARSGTATNLLVENCHFYRTGGALDGINKPAIRVKAGVIDATIRTSFFEDTYAEAISLDHQPASQRVKIYNNVFRLRLGSSRLAIHLDAPEDAEVYNNTIVMECESGLERCIGIRLGVAARRSVVRNNIIHVSGDGAEPLRVNGSIAEADWVHEDNFYVGAVPDGIHESNITGDPMFQDEAAGDYALQLGSDAIDQGSSTPLFSTDFLGNPRDDAFDLGAYEYVP